MLGISWVEGWTAHRAELCTLQGVCALPALGVVVLMQAHLGEEVHLEILLIWCDLPLWCAFCCVVTCHSARKNTCLAASIRD